MALFKEHVGDLSIRDVTQSHAASFRDVLQAQGLSKQVIGVHLYNLRGMFSAAVSEAIIGTNPVAGVVVRGKQHKVPKAVFTGPQLVAVLDKAIATKFGGKRHTEALWLLRLAVYTGCRINEAAQLRRDDVRTDPMCL